ncbi:uncharacterized protein LOC120353844 [Nilaparvata lugens]|uniref:uncharacterized protein LOC120353844 n=1 Tax=Nilaparvata lugens TaxID=108931 RepID=UPI00193E8C6B|nr:uncharacterized protein LOC120353844 [Nilaparvata lugens]
MKLRVQDLERCNGSASLLFDVPRGVDDSEAAYFGLNLPFHCIRLMIQLRLATRRQFNLTSRGNIHKIRADQLCSICNLQQLESVEHVLFSCPQYAAPRAWLIGRVFSFDCTVMSVISMKFFI